MTIHPLSGHLTFQSFEILERMVSAAAVSGETEFILDMSDVAFIDTFALSMIHLARKETIDRGGCFSIVGASGTVDYLLRHGDEQSSDTVPETNLPVALMCHHPLSAAAQQWAEEHDLRVQSFGNPDLAGYACICCDAGSGDAITQSLTGQGAGFVEQTADGDVRLGHHGLVAVRRGGFVISVTTVTANQINLVEHMTTLIRSRFPSRRRESDSLVDLCLGEAISNAVIHGNLGIASSMRTMSDRFRAFYAMMKERLADPVLGRKRVEIALLPLSATSFTISVSDEGDGFDVGRELSKPLDPTAMYGHGLPMIRKIASSVWADDGGRCLVMQF